MQVEEYPNVRFADAVCRSAPPEAVHELLPGARYDDSVGGGLATSWFGVAISCEWADSGGGRVRVDLYVAPNPDRPREASTSEVLVDVRGVPTTISMVRPVGDDVWTGSRPPSDSIDALVAHLDTVISAGMAEICGVPIDAVLASHPDAGEAASFHTLCAASAQPDVETSEEGASDALNAVLGALDAGDTEALSSLVAPEYQGDVLDFVRSSGDALSTLPAGDQFECERYEDDLISCWPIDSTVPVGFQFVGSDGKWLLQMIFGTTD
jgi:hypothetical protein